jgi:DNA repair exonuclease SbcCD nuclease subunit
MQTKDSFITKFILTGDWHLDTNSPENRTDNYFQTQHSKIHFILNKAHQLEAEYILQPGDFFNSHKANNYLLQHYIDLFMKWRPAVKIFTIYGQHDMRFHSSDRENTPLAVMKAAGLVQILGARPTIITGGAFPVYLYGCSWGEDIPVRQDSKVPGTTHILLIHKMIVKDEKLWEGQEDFMWANNLLLQSGFNLIVSGDNHQSFTLPNRKQLLVNAGSLMRSTIDQVNHQPIIYLYNPTDWSCVGVTVPIEPFNKVMNAKKAEEQKKRNEELESFVEILSKGAKIDGLDFMANLWAKAKSLPMADGELRILKEVLA